MITLETYLNNKEKEYPDEWNFILEKAALSLLEKINGLFAEIDFKDPVVTSGFRPPSYNAKVPRAAKRSKHTTCHAIDIADVNNELESKLTDKLLEKYGLYIEDPGVTDKRSYIHFQDIAPHSGKRRFIPY